MFPMGAVRMYRSYRSRKYALKTLSITLSRGWATGVRPPGMGMKSDGTSDEKIGLLWDEFRAQSSAVVKEYCQSLLFFYPKIIPGGLTPVAQPLDTVINKVFKYMIYTSSPLQ